MNRFKKLLKALTALNISRQLSKKDIQMEVTQTFKL